MILVTGATGFLGKNVCEKLSAQGVAYTKTSLTTTETTIDGKPLACDLRNREETLRLFEKIRPTSVIHCAAFVGGIQFGYKYPVPMFEDNLLMNLNIYRAAHEYKVARVVNPVSNCAYPARSEFFKEEEFWEGPLHESVLYYGVSRKATVVAGQAYGKQYGLDTLHLVLPNMYGPQDHFEEERSHALGALVKKCVDAERTGAESINVWGTGKPVREWLYVKDAAEALVRGLKIPAQKDILNIGSGEGISVRDLVGNIAEATGFKGGIIFDETKPDGAPYKTMDAHRAKAILDWSPTTSLRDGLKITVDWYKKNFAK
jgi:GDP-L-fucose synthase